MDYQELDANGNVIADLGTTAPSTAGSYQVTASFAGATDYTSASAVVPFSIGLLTPTVTVSDFGNPNLGPLALDDPYTGAPYVATATIAGSDGVANSTLESVGLTLDYQELDGNGDVIADLGSSAPVTPGSYQVVASFAGSADYLAGSAQRGRKGDGHLYFQPIFRQRSQISLSWVGRVAARWPVAPNAVRSA